ncbi:MAG TPA: tetratricopeptide repeat protein [Burkholderiales bacterium]|nr:tetratricopeptide repeat protein [Burkholderiales bacterium]
MKWLGGLLGKKAKSAEAPGRETLDDWLRAGYAHAVRGELAQSEALYRRILEHDARDPDALYFLGILATLDGRETEAAEFFRSAIEARPGDAAFWVALGGVCHSQLRYDEAAEAFREGVRLQPEHDVIRMNYAAALIDLGRGDEAREEMERVLASGYESGQLRYNLGHVYRDQARIEEAVACMRRAMELEPEDPKYFTNLLFTLNYSDRCDAAALFAEHARYGARFAKPYSDPPLDRAWPRRLRIGYVSPDFRRHVVACFVEPILAHRERSRFEVFCYYNHRAEDSFTARLRGLADHWIECVHLSDAQLAERIRADRIDILVDLAGHTADNRVPLFTMKPAPVQMTYLGYPNTTGLSSIDWRISDALADPPGEAERLSAERILRPWTTYFCYRPPEKCPEVGALPALENGYVTFGCFNNLPKLSPSFVRAAAKVLAAVPRSRLRLKSRLLHVPHVMQRFRAAFVSEGIEAGRVDLRGWEEEVESHLAAYGSVDIALDSFPYNGATTTCEALWMGVPVVSIAGDRHAGRMGSSILSAVGLAELVARDVDGYVERCAALAADPQRLAQMRAGLRERVRRSPLMDEAGFTRALERDYIAAWEDKIAPKAAQVLDEREAARVLEQAQALRASGDRIAAEARCKEVLAARPADLAAQNLLWDLSYETGNHGVAVEWLRLGLAAAPDVARLHYMMGYSLLGQGNPADAAASFRRALELEPGMAKAMNNLGVALEATGGIGEAAECYAKARELDPGLADAQYNFGNALRQLGQFDAAIEHLRRALEMDRSRPDWHSNLADLLNHRMQIDEAAAAYSKAIEIDPEYARGYSGRANAYEMLGFAERYEPDLQKAMALAPRNEHLASQWLFALHFRHGDDGERLLAAHREWASRHAARIARQCVRSEGERAPQRRLNIGYVSADFKRHSVANFLEPLLAAHDRSRFKIFGYCNLERPDEVTDRLRGLCEEWREIAGVHDDHVAERLRADRIDILVDLSGHTPAGRMLLFARKPAPIQVTWLGYPDTTGLAAMDYRLTDAVADPEGETDRFHVERLVRLPSGFLCYAPPAEAPEVGKLPCEASGQVTFGCFNHLPKLSPPIIATWARLLQRLPSARLVLKSFGLAEASAQRSLREQFAAHGIGAERVLLAAPEVTLEAHLARYHEIDIALDVFPYNGTTTTCEALWMGVPVVSRAGRTHVTRVGASLLHRVGLDELVARSEEEYIAKALALATDLPRLAGLRAGLRERMKASSLLDARAFTGALEAAFAEMWARWQSEQSARDQTQPQASPVAA